jgi:SAM-dependent methyltransferase
MNEACGNPYVYSSWQRLFIAGKHESLRHAIQSARLPEKADILDIGCGTGQDAELFCDAARYRYIGIDISEPYIMQARKKYPGLEFIAADIRRNNLELRADLVLVDSVLHHLQDEEIDRFLSIIEKCLKPNGCLVLQDMYRSGMMIPAIMMKLDRGANGNSLLGLTKLLEKSFRVESQFDYRLQLFGVTLYNMAVFLCRRKILDA